MDLFGLLMFSLTGALIGIFTAIPYTAISPEYNFVERLSSAFRIGYWIGTVGEVVDIVQPPNHPSNTWHTTLTYSTGNLPAETDFISLDLPNMDFVSIETQTEIETATATGTVTVTVTETVHLFPTITYDDADGGGPPTNLAAKMTNPSTGTSHGEEDAASAPVTTFKIVIPHGYFSARQHHRSTIGFSQWILDAVSRWVSSMYEKMTPKQSKPWSPPIVEGQHVVIDAWLIMFLLGIPVTLLLVAIPAGRSRFRAVLRAGQNDVEQHPLNNRVQFAAGERSVNQTLEDLIKGSSPGTGEVSREKEQDERRKTDNAPPYATDEGGQGESTESFKVDECFLRNMFNSLFDEKTQSLNDNIQSLSDVFAQLTRDVRNDFGEQAAQIRALGEKTELLGMEALEYVTTEKLENQVETVEEAKEAISKFMKKVDEILSYYKDLEEKTKETKTITEKNMNHIKELQEGLNSTKTVMEKNTTDIKDLQRGTDDIRIVTGIQTNDIEELHNSVNDTKILRGENLNVIEALQVDLNNMKTEVHDLKDLCQELENKIEWRQDALEEGLQKLRTQFEEDRLSTQANKSRESNKANDAESSNGGNSEANSVTSTESVSQIQVHHLPTFVNPTLDNGNEIVEQSHRAAGDTIHPVKDAEETVNTPSIIFPTTPEKQSAETSELIPPQQPNMMSASIINLNSADSETSIFPANVPTTQPYQGLHQGTRATGTKEFKYTSVSPVFPTRGFEDLKDKAVSDMTPFGNNETIRSSTVTPENKWQDFAGKESGAPPLQRPNQKNTISSVGSMGPDRDRFLKEGRCFGCGKPGHIKRTCPEDETASQLKNLRATNRDIIEKESQKASSSPKRTATPGAPTSLNPKVASAKTDHEAKSIGPSIGLPHRKEKSVQSSQWADSEIEEYDRVRNSPSYHQDIEEQRQRESAAGLRMFKKDPKYNSDNSDLYLSRWAPR